jgi:7-carboxy-7-deazaguanine synthase
MVKEIYYTLQGEGGQSGLAAVFCRFTGCNLWSGREEDRAGAVCPFCDTDFVGLDGPGGGRYETAEALAEAVRRAWPRDTSPLARRLVVCTGGEPLLQLDHAAIEAFHAAGFDIAVETNGTLPVPPGVDWVCVSPKAGTDLVVREGDELKLVFPQEGLDPAQLTALPFRHFYLQPMDGPDREGNTRLATDYCLRHPEWRLSLQTHKVVGLP